MGCCFGSLKMWFEERETQAAELWRIIGTCLGGLQILWRRCISEHHHDWLDSGNRVKSIVECMPVTQISLDQIQSK
jgi:hypothetical protein